MDHCNADNIWCSQKGEHILTHRLNIATRAVKCVVSIQIDERCTQFYKTDDKNAPAIILVISASYLGKISKSLL